MAALTVASSACAALPAAPVASLSQSTFSTASTVRMTPLKVNRRLCVVAMATPPNREDVKDKIPNAIAEAQKACEEDPTSAPCAVAWDEVEELTAEAAHQRDREKTSGDPLEKYCADNPESDECRTYED
ncbi:calvin cycle protein CP12, chloroplastic [Physcomitrium patens]|uniref:CP12 domain-containing protein n=1 Tax=Physcomitrium patens TaxID=3218 RepID=A0A2K1KUG4_PHYPA|nr:calvin cycle protein CP12-1, chloroplastic-like [Physcomitrium patens]PNR57427.1 hypothetical protein PHYPA_004421 [Physcomitrium patens]|eukprot:XP_024371739.1 calvin cycle protein CP12-1, chloroplastic-like [Physcomitrella patens]